MTRASDTAKLLGAGGSILGSLDVGGGQISGRRNILINGAMNVAQRSTSVTGIGASSGYFTCDRWQIGASNTAGRLTQTQTADGPNGISANCLKLDCTTADTSIASNEYLYIAQNLEGQDVQAIGKGVTGAKQVTLSFYVKANAAFTFVAEIQDLDNGRIIAKSYATTTDWVRHEMIFDADTDDGSSPFDDDNGASLAVNFWLHAGSNYTSGTLNTSWENRTDANRYVGGDSFFSSTDNNFFITGVQLEVGSVATPFESRSFGEELALCQRYYYRHAAATHIGNGGYQTSGQVDVIVDYPVTMRAGPSLDHPTGTNYYRAMRRDAYDDFDSFAIYLSSAQNVLLYQTSGVSGTVGDYARMYCNANGIISFDAEL